MQLKQIIKMFGGLKKANKKQQSNEREEVNLKVLVVFAMFFGNVGNFFELIK